METEWWADLTVYWPPWLWVIAGCLLGLFVCVRFLSLSSESVAKVFGPVGAFFRNRRAISQAESDDMRRQIIGLDKRVRALLYRDECYFAYMMTDAEWHRRHELMAIASGWEFEPHVPFLFFRDQWMLERGLDKEIELWK